MGDAVHVVDAVNVADGVSVGKPGDARAIMIDM